MLTNDHN